MNIFDGIKLPKIIYSVDSKYNGKIDVWENNNVRKVVVSGFTQSITHTSSSCQRLYWGKTIEVLKEQVPDLKNVLVFGLGGATLQHLLANNFPGIEITSVELDPEMINIAKNYFDLDSIPDHRIINEDVLRLVIEPEQFDILPASYDCLIMDVFVGDKYPDLGKSGNFISGVKKLVKSGGLILFNRMYRDEHQDEVNVFIDYVSNFLADVECTVVAGHTNSDNVLIYGKK